MNKFKIGDSVKIIKNGDGSTVNSYDKYIGTKSKIETIEDSTRYGLVLQGNTGMSYWEENELELVQEEYKPLTMSNIKIGMKVVPFQKTAGSTDYDNFILYGEEISKFFKDNGYLYVAKFGDYGMIGLNSTGNKLYSCYYFNTHDLEIYKENKPKVAEILGLEIGNTYNIEGYSCNPCIVDERYVLVNCENTIVGASWIMRIINNPSMLTKIEKPQPKEITIADIKEFMVIKDKNEEYGVIIRNNSSDYPFRICYKSGGQIIGNDVAKYVIEVYESTRQDMKDIIFDALQFLLNPNKNIANYKLVFPKTI